MAGNAPNEDCLISKIPWAIWIYLALLTLFSVPLALNSLFQMSIMTSEFGGDRLTIKGTSAKGISI